MQKGWEDNRGVHPIGREGRLFELGATSLGVARLSEQLRRMFRVELPLAAIFQARTVTEIAALIRDRRPSASASALAPIRPEGSLPPLFLCEGIGIYYPMIRYLDPEQPVYALVTEVSQNYPRVEALAAAYIDEVRAVQPEGPYFLGGLSFGGLVAFEMALQFFATGQEVGLLALFDTPTPWASRPKPGLRRLAGHFANLRRFGSAYVRWKLGRRLAGLRRRLESRQDAAPQILADEDRLRHLLGTTAAHYEMRPYPGPIALFALAERDGMSDALFDPALDDIDPQLGWGRLAPGRVAVHDVPGEHVSMFREPYARVLAEKLTACLEVARGPAVVPAGRPDQDGPTDP
jgi:thioesterase domain-containing protein